MKQIQTKPTRLWFLSRGYKQADPRHTNGYAIWLHPHTNDVLTQNGYKLSLQVVPYEKHLKTKARYLKLNRQHGGKYLARLKYLTFKGDIKPNEVIDHIDGNTFNNDIRNLRAVPRSINDRDGGFQKKLRNKGIQIAMFPGIILEGFERMAQWKAAHTEWQYRKLEHDDLLRIFLGPTLTVCDPNILMDLELTKHCEL